jgi:hypothetical protein
MVKARLFIPGLGFIEGSYKVPQDLMTLRLPIHGGDISFEPITCNCYAPGIKVAEFQMDESMSVAKKNEELGGFRTFSFTGIKEL